MSFIVIWDTCTSPEYYADLHNVLALPEGYIVRYEYTKKRFDCGSCQEFEKLLNEKISSIDVVLFYGEVDNYEKGGKSPEKGDRVSKIVPFRRGKVIAATCLVKDGNDQESKIVYDIELLGYPSPACFEQLKWKFTEYTKNRVPFSYWHTYINDDDLENALLNEKNSNSNHNWRSIVDKLNECQFKNDSFWHINIASATKNDAVKFSKEKSNDSLFSTTLIIKDEQDIYFSVEYINPKYDSSIKLAPRSILVTSTDNIKIGKSEIPLRPYSKHNLHLRGISDTYIKGEIASIELNTHTPAPIDNYPVGPNFTINTSIHKGKCKLITGVLLGIISIPGLALSSKLSIYREVSNGVKEFNTTNIFYIIIGMVLSSLLFLISGYLLRKEFKLK